MTSRKSSMLTSLPARSTCQKVQPLQAGRPCASAPILWIEPTAGPSVERAVGADERPMAALRVDERFARLDETRFDHAGECDARFAALASASPRPIRARAARRRRSAPAPPRRRLVSRSRPMIIAAEPSRDRAGGAGAEERVEHEIAGVGGGDQQPLQQRLRLLRRMGLASVGVLQPFGAGADRQEPVGARLDVVVAGLQRLVVEGVALGVGAARRPDHRLVGVGEAPAAEVRHRIGLAPDDVVEDPEAEVLQDRADAEDVVIGADDDDRRVALHHPPRRAEPGAGERVVGGEVGELVPIVVDRVDHALVGARQRAFELQIVRRIGEDEIDARLGQLARVRRRSRRR